MYDALLIVIFKNHNRYQIKIFIFKCRYLSKTFEIIGAVAQRCQVGLRCYNVLQKEVAWS
jgi:hypothetical protein